MRGVGAYSADEDVRDPRRALTDDELGRLILAAESGPVCFDMDGSLRSMAYRLAASTGFRADELRSLTPESFRLDDREPTILLRASSTKNRRSAEQLIPSTLAKELRRWLQAMPPNQSVLPLHYQTAKAMRADLERAGIPYRTDEGKADFHSLRSYFTSALVRCGASIAEVHKLTRHAKAETTLKHYVKVSVRLRGAVESMPTVTAIPDRTELERLAKTSTDGETHKQTLPTYHPPISADRCNLVRLSAG
jgi:integrase